MHCYHNFGSLFVRFFAFFRVFLSKFLTFIFFFNLHRLLCNFFSAVFWKFFGSLFGTFFALVTISYVVFIIFLVICLLRFSHFFSVFLSKLQTCIFSSIFFISFVVSFLQFLDICGSLFGTFSYFLGFSTVSFHIVGSWICCHSFWTTYLCSSKLIWHYIQYPFFCCSVHLVCCGAFYIHFHSILDLFSLDSSIHFIFFSSSLFCCKLDGFHIDNGFVTCFLSHCI